MDAYNVVIIQPYTSEEDLTFSDLGTLLKRTLRSLGKNCDLTVNRILKDRINIILGARLLSESQLADLHSATYIIYQLEQLSRHEGWFTDQLDSILRTAEYVWDYSPENVVFLREQGIPCAKFVPIGYHQKIQQVVHSKEKDIDILFYGLMNERRAQILRPLSERFNVKILSDCYGAQRDHYIGRAKILLNIHYYEAKLMEQVRVSYLLNNKCFVISEESQYNPYIDGIVTAHYQDMQDACEKYINRPLDRDRVAEHGYQMLRTQPMTQILNRVLTTHCFQ